MNFTKDYSTHYRFPWEKDGENVLFVVRSFFPKFLLSFFSVGGLFFLSVGLFFLFADSFDFYHHYYEYINTIALIILGIGVFWMIYLWFEWVFDVCVITTHRIIDSDQNGFFHQRFKEAGLNKVEDVVYEIKGLWQTLFNFGNVTIYTSGSEEGFVFENVHNPARMQQSLFKIIDEYQSIQNTEEEKPVTVRELFEYFKERDSKLFSENQPIGTSREQGDSAITL